MMPMLSSFWSFFSVVGGQLVTSTLSEQNISADLGPTHHGLSDGTVFYAHRPRPASKERLLCRPCDHHRHIGHEFMTGRWRL